GARGGGASRLGPAIAPARRGGAGAALTSERPRIADREAVAGLAGAGVAFPVHPVAGVALQRHGQAKRAGQGGERQDFWQSFHDPISLCIVGKPQAAAASRRCASTKNTPVTTPSTPRCSHASPPASWPTTFIASWPRWYAGHTGARSEEHTSEL